MMARERGLSGYEVPGETLFCSSRLLEWSGNFKKRAFFCLLYSMTVLVLDKLILQIR